MFRPFIRQADSFFCAEVAQDHEPRPRSDLSGGQAQGLLPDQLCEQHGSTFDNEIGDKCFILKDNTNQPFISIGNNMVLWSATISGITVSFATM